MGAQTFGLGKRANDRSNLAETYPIEALHGDDFEEVVDAKPSAKAGRAGGRKNVVRAGRIVSCGLRRVVTDKDRAGAVDVGKAIVIQG